MGKTGFLFAGQGSQYVGMGKDLYEAFPQSRQVFDTACEVLGSDLKQLMFEGPEDQLKLTVHAQPAIVTASIAAYEAFKAASGIVPVYAAGLSLGEYSALIASGVFTFADGIKLIQQRGQIMDEVARMHPGAMAAVLDLPVEKITQICQATGAEIANLNCPGQTVITGKAEAVDLASQQCSQAGAKKVIKLAVSGGFHSSLMLEASVRLKAVLDTITFHAPGYPVISNYTAKPQVTEAQIKENLVKQIHSSVRWEESVRLMLAQGVAVFYEFGPGKVLKGLMRKTDAQAQVTVIEKKEDIQQAKAGSL